MFKPILAAVFCVALSACNPATTDPADLTPWQDVLVNEGLATTEANLLLRTDSAENDFLLGGIQFLRASEAIMQVRYRNTSTPLALIPGMRNQLPPNPDATFDPAFLEIAMTEALTHLARAETSLGRVTGQDFAVNFPLTSVWFDVNANGKRENWETALSVMKELGAEPEGAFDGIVRFDSADAYWLKAYVHVMAGMAELTLATDPTPAIRTVAEGSKAMQEIGQVQRLFGGGADWADTFAAVLLTLRGTPDKSRTRTAHRHFKAMIAENRSFWAAVVLETDDNHEWLPNPQQTSAFGVQISQEIVDGWREVLGEMSAIIEGDALIPYWRYDNGHDAEQGIGVNVAKFLQNPGDMDIVLWIHGAAAAPYLETGALAQMQAWRRFARMTGGDGLMFAAWFN